MVEKEKVLEALRRGKGDILSRPNVVGIGVGYKEKGGLETSELSLVVLVEKKLPREVLSAQALIPERIAEVRTDVVEVGRLRALGSQHQNRLRPAQPGGSIGHYRITAGTFGAVVYYGQRGEPVILSNNHVLANATNGRDGRARRGDPILQPGPYDGGRPEDAIARLLKYVPVYTYRGDRLPLAAAAPSGDGLRLFANNHGQGEQVGPARSGRRLLRQNLVDAAIARPLDPDLIDSTILEVGEVSRVAEATLRQEVLKSGRTTGLTRGRVRTLHVTVQVEYGEGRVAIFTEQVVTTAMSQGGDSGSLILDRDRRAVGLLFAGSDQATIFSPIGAVERLLGVRVAGKAR